jgi:hypothetical protein
MKCKLPLCRFLIACICTVVFVNCSDSLNKSPIFFFQPPIVDPKWKAVDAFASATPPHDLAVIGGVITSTTCTLFIRMTWCNGETVIRWGEQPFQYYQTEKINVPPSCPCSTSGLQQFTQVITGLTPNTTYYVNLYGLWLNAGVYPFEWDIYDTIVTPEG